MSSNCIALDKIVDPDLFRIQIQKDQSILKQKTKMAPQKLEEIKT